MVMGRPCALKKVGNGYPVDCGTASVQEAVRHLEGFGADGATLRIVRHEQGMTWTDMSRWVMGQLQLMEGDEYEYETHVVQRQSGDQLSGRNMDSTRERSPDRRAYEYGGDSGRQSRTPRKGKGKGQKGNGKGKGKAKGHAQNWQGQGATGRGGPPGGRSPEYGQGARFRSASPGFQRNSGKGFKGGKGTPECYGCREEGLPHYHNHLTCPVWQSKP